MDDFDIPGLLSAPKKGGKDKKRRGGLMVNLASPEDRALYDKVDRLASRYGLTKAEVVRRILNWALFPEKEGRGGDQT